MRLEKMGALDETLKNAYRQEAAKFSTNLDLIEDDLKQIKLDKVILKASLDSGNSLETRLFEDNK